MRYYYKNKNDDFYSPHIADGPVIWLSGSLVALVGTSWAWLSGFKGWLISEVWFLAVIIFLVLITFEVINAKRHLGSLKRLPSCIICSLLYLNRVNVALLNSRNKASITNHSYRVIPKMWLYKDGADLVIKMEKLAGTYEEDLPRLAELVSSAVGESWRITSKIQEDSESWFKFVLSPVDRNLVFIPKNIQDLQQPLYQVKLQKNLILDFSKNPHLACFGKTGSGKSTVLWSIILQTIGNSNLYFEDFKNEFSILNGFYPKDHFATTSEQILIILEKLVKIMNQRKEVVSKEAKRRGVIGLTGYDMNMKPIYLIADEWASVMSAFGTDKEGRKQKKHCEDLIKQLLMQSRSCAINVLYASQSPSTDVLSNQNRSQFGTYILLGSANGDVQRMVFDEVATIGSVGRFSGYYMQSTADMETPQKFYVPDIYKHGLNKLGIFETLYKKVEKK